MTQPDQVLFNTLEQLISADMNLIGSLAGKAAQDAMLSLVRDPDNIFTVNRPIDGVRRGLTSSIGAGLTIDIAPGEIAIVNGATAFDADLSPYELGRLATTTNVNVGPADGTNPRVTLISAAISQIDTNGTTRNILTLPARTVTPTVVNKRRNPTMTLTATPGAPAVNPVIPALPANNIPLYAVYIPAGAATIAATDVADMRVWIAGWIAGSAQGRIEGVYPLPDTTVGSIKITNGRASVVGAPIYLSADVVHPAASFLPAGTGALAASTEYQVYAIASGVGVAVGKSNPNFAIFVAVTGNPPNGFGSPTAAITYRPLWESNTAANVWQETTSRALYIGSLFTDPTGALERRNGNGYATNRRGTHRFKLAANGGLAPDIIGGWIKRPRLVWTSSTTVRIEDGCCILGGQPVEFSDIIVDITADLAAGDVETASTWYYVYVRRSVAALSSVEVTSVVGVISSEAPTELNTKPTPEAGFANTDYVYVGSVLNNQASDLQQFIRTGNNVLFVPHGPEISPMPGGGNGPNNGAFALATTAAVFEAWLPANASIALAAIRINRAAGGTVGARIMHLTGNTNSNASAAYIVTPPTGAGEEAEINCQIYCNVSNQWEAFETSASDLSLIWLQTGYIEDLY